MESCPKTTTPMTIPTLTEKAEYSHSQLSPTSVLTPIHSVVLSPCAACKILRRRCIEKCMLAPYFPPTDPHKFTIAHRVFGASNIIKLLQELPESHRIDAVSSMVYEANARLRDPIYGCAGTICQLQKQVSELQAELAKAQAEMVTLQCRQTNILTLIRMQMEQPSPPPAISSSLQLQNLYENINFFDDSANFSSLEPLWT
ncbi:LOB domain-containing protein 1-like [Rutidosis leptorrhynchoides]|uniref:LOB domain-containing protein 1-like n=1 Tax=Rutidosis leptorrhynchoides TaxID=125765 RepID=UPI003A99172C